MSHNGMSSTALVICMLLSFFAKEAAGNPISLHPRQDQDQNQGQPIITTLQQTSEFSTFYSLFSSAGGGAEGDISPEFQGRFNNPRNADQYTLLAPTDEAFQSLPLNTLEALKFVPSYGLLSTLLRNCFIDGRRSLQDLTNAESNRAVGGFTFSVDRDGSITSNENLTQSEVPIRQQANLIFNQNRQPVTVEASNGIIYAIDRMIDPLITYFGEDAPNGGLPEIRRQEGTMGDLVQSHPDLSTLASFLERIDPEFLDRLSLSSNDQEVNQRTVYLAPSNTAFNVLPKSIFDTATQPSNGQFSQYVLEFGLGEFRENEGVVRSLEGLDIMIQRGRVNNAAVEDRVCVGNGCVWLVGRWLDPVFGMFG